MKFARPIQLNSTGPSNSFALLIEGENIFKYALFEHVYYWNCSANAVSNYLHDIVVVI
jgi:hypothetical protein